MTYRLKNNVIKDSNGKIKFRKFTDDGYEHYHVGLWLAADSSRELDRVEYVEYELHPTFSKRTRKSRARHNDFSITFWSWGTFTVTAKIHLVKGAVEEIKHELVYELPWADSDYVQIN